MDIGGAQQSDEKARPLVVGIFRNPRRSTVGDTSSQASMPAIIRKMVLKNIAVGTVQYIHSKVMLIPL
jgi:hypothetical protein